MGELFDLNYTPQTDKDAENGSFETLKGLLRKSPDEFQRMSYLSKMLSSAESIEQLEEVKRLTNNSLSPQSGQFVKVVEARIQAYKQSQTKSQAA